MVAGSPEFAPQNVAEWLERAITVVKEDRIAALEQGAFIGVTILGEAVMQQALAVHRRELAALLALDPQTTTKHEIDNIMAAAEEEVASIVAQAKAPQG